MENSICCAVWLPHWEKVISSTVADMRKTAEKYFFRYGKHRQFLTLIIVPVIMIIYMIMKKKTAPSFLKICPFLLLRVILKCANIKVSKHREDLKPERQGFEKLLIASDRTNLIRKVYFLLKSGFQVIAFSIIIEAGYLVTIAVNFV